MHFGPHTHHDGCEHTHALKLNRSFALAVVLNVLLVVGEAVAGVVSGSMALLADAGHNLGDVAGLALAWGAHFLRGKGTDARWTYGWRGFTMLAANVNGVLLVVAIVFVAIESVRRLYAPADIAEVPVIIVASLATVLNFATARLLMSDGSDLNVRGAYLHMLADAAVSFAVVIGAIVMLFTDASWLDPLLSLAICVVLAFGTWGLLKESTLMLMNAAPLGFKTDEVREFLLSSPEIHAIDDLHIWSVSTTDVILTARIRCPNIEMQAQDQLVCELHEGLKSQFGISHATIEVSRGVEFSQSCSLE